MNERGYLTFMLLGFLPVLMTTLAAVVSAFMLFKADSASKHICRLELLRAQDSLSDQLRNLIALNTRATSLRLQRQAAEVQIALGGPLAAAALARVTAQQMAFGARQRALILRAKLLCRTAPELALIGAKREIGRTFAPLTKNVPVISGHATSASFDVVATPPFELTPDYAPSARFRESQEMKATWSFEITSLLPAWIRHFLGNAHIRTTGECSATLEKGTNRWLPRITMGKL